MSLLTTGQAVAGYQGVDALFRTIVELSDGLLSRAHLEHTDDEANGRACRTDLQRTSRAKPATDAVGL